MALYNSPIIKKFFTNKIESSSAEWGDYLLEVADIFSMFDGEELDRDLIADRFSTISGRSPYALRDSSNFRDEFGAYGTYLGLFHYDFHSGTAKIVLSKAAKHYLCSTEPDVESYCRLQMALFQYPNGAGAVIQTNGNMHPQSNAFTDTVREINNNIRINPLRLLCRVVVVMHEYMNVPLDQITIPYTTIFMLVNDNAVNNCFSPAYEVLLDVLKSYENHTIPNWATGNFLTNFKRNFHIMERTGIFSRVHRNGLSLKQINTNKVYKYVKEIAEMNTNFSAFENCYNNLNVNDAISAVISSSKWGEYFDALSLPMNTLSALSDEISFSDYESTTMPIGSIRITDNAFPSMQVYKSEQIRTFTSSDNYTDPYETLVRREKANREHARILNMLAAKIRFHKLEVFENTFIDLYTLNTDTPYIIEVKSNTEKNTLSQIRKAIAQLYEYRYRSKMTNAVLCIVLQNKPTQSWVEDYLLHDRGILFCWMVDDTRLECPSECRKVLSSIGIIEE